MKYLLVLSGEDYKLAFEEVKGILLQDEKAEFLQQKERLIVIDTVLEKEYLRNRLVYTNIIADFVDVKLASEDEVKEVKLEITGTFAIDQKTIESEVEIEKIMKALADTIDNKVDLDNPDTTVLLLLRKKRAWVGLNPLYKESIQERMVKNRPFMDPTSMNPKEAKLIINLSGVKEGETLLDPFCGAGGILIEAGLMGIKTQGIELEKEVYEGCKKNLEFYKVKDYEVKLADSMQKKFDKEFDVIVTDPPYGISSRSFGKGKEEVYDMLLSKIGTDFKVKKRLVLLSPFDLKPLLKKHKINLYKELSLYIHKGLTRHIYICHFG